jgi:hypothetical protein
MYSDDRLSGIELLALYGDDDRIGFDLKKGFGKAFAVTPAGAAYNYGMRKTKRTRKRMYGDDDRLGAFLPGLKKVGKLTSGITGGIAKTFLPAATVDALSKLDPTKKGTVTQKITAAKKAASAPPPNKKGNDKIFEAIGKKMMEPNAKNIMIIAGSGIGALILLKILLSSHK